MAGNSRPSFTKRQKERSRQEKQAEKAQKKAQRKQQTDNDADPPPPSRWPTWWSLMTKKVSRKALIFMTLRSSLVAAAALPLLFQPVSLDTCGILLLDAISHGSLVVRQSDPIS